MTSRIAIILGISGAAATLLSGCVEGGYGYVGVGVEAPPPLVVGVAVYPDYYVWDGFEYVGIVGGRYYYLGPNRVWLACEPFRVTRFESWKRGHADWRAHATYNAHYRSAYRGPGNDRGGNGHQGRGRGHAHGH